MAEGVHRHHHTGGMLQEENENRIKGKGNQCWSSGAYQGSSTHVRDCQDGKQTFHLWAVFHTILSSSSVSCTRECIISGMREGRREGGKRGRDVGRKGRKGGRRGWVTHHSTTVIMMNSTTMMRIATTRTTAITMTTTVEVGLEAAAAAVNPVPGVKLVGVSREEEEEEVPVELEEEEDVGVLSVWLSTEVKESQR